VLVSRYQRDHSSYQILQQGSNDFSQRIKLTTTRNDPALVSFAGLMERTTKVAIVNLDAALGMERMCGRMEGNTPGIGRIVRCMAAESTFGPMEKRIQANTSTGSNTVKVRSSGQMVVSTAVAGCLGGRKERGGSNMREAV
jgi:hypothetical protein